MYDDDGEFLPTDDFAEHDDRYVGPSRTERGPCRTAGAGSDSFDKDVRQYLVECGSFCLATVDERGWPRIQHRSGPPGFLHTLGHHRLGWADLRRNVQSIAAVTAARGHRVELFIVNESSRCSLKISGRGRVAFIEDEPDLVAKLAGEAHESLVDCAVVVSVDSHDWNRLRDTPAGSTAAEMAVTLDTLKHRLTALQAENAQLRTLLDRRPGSTDAPYGEARGPRRS